jgi:hypothetical protein
MRVALEQAQGLQAAITGGPDHRNPLAGHGWNPATPDRTGLYKSQSTRGFALLQP